MSVILYSNEVWGVCKCDHYDWQHSDFVYGGEDGYDIIPKQNGHGACGAQSEVDEEGNPAYCSCKQFTWVKTISHRRNVHGSTPKPCFKPSYEPEESIDGKMTKFTIKREE